MEGQSKIANWFRSLTKKQIIPMAIVLGLIVAFVIVFPSVYCVALKVDLKMSAVQVDDTQNIKVTWDTSENIDQMTLSLYHGKDLISEETLTDPTAVNAGEKTVEAFYGKITVKMKIKKGIYTTSQKKEVKLSAEEYNIAPITATMPVTIFSLSLSEITDNGRIPTFVWFKRSGAWDWNNLTENVYPMPTAKGDEFYNSGERVMYKKTSAYVKELYEINPKSKFHFYYNDYFVYGWVQATIANGIPTENYDVVLLSDGTASFSYFNKHFDNPETAENEYARMAAQWKMLKNQVAKNKKYDAKSKTEIKAEPLREYAYIMATEEPNVQWWLTRINGTLANNNPDMYAKVEANANIKVKDLNTLLQAIQKDESENPYLTEASLKKLYNFSDDMFEKAAKNGKEIMVILGTWTSTENESYFDQYVRATMAYYGDGYEYYYKGHPKNPTNSEKGKLEKLNSMGLTDVDSTIPAELIFFFNPEAFCSGYASTTFVSLAPEKCCSIFNSTMSGFTQSYKDSMDVFMSKLSGNVGNITVGNDCYLLEFVDTSAYDIAIFDNAKNAIKYYKKSGDDTYTEVTRK